MRPVLRRYWPELACIVGLLAATALLPGAWALVRRLRNEPPPTPR